VHGVIDRAHARSILHKQWLFTVRACARPIQLHCTQWLITVRLTTRPNVSDQLTLLPVRAQAMQVVLLDKEHV